VNKYIKVKRNNTHYYSYFNFLIWNCFFVMVENKKKKEIDDDLERIKERRLNLVNDNQKRSRNKIL